MFNQNFTIFYYLLLRDIKSIFTTLYNSLLNSFLFIALQVLVCGKLLVTMGADSGKIGSVLLGNVLIIFLMAGYNRALEMILDVTYAKRITFEMRTPISNNWFLLRMVVSTVIYFFCFTLPAIPLTWMMAGSVIDFSNMRVGLFFLVYILSSINLAVIYLFLAFALDYKTFRHHLWSRVIGPMVFLGPVLYSYKDAQAQFPVISKFMLLNPYTYVLEGTKASIFNKDGFLSVWLCIFMISILSIIFFIFLKRSVKARLDHV